MTARPVIPEKQRMSFLLVIALVLMIVALLLTAGCSSPPVDTPVSDTTQVTMTPETKTTYDPMSALRSYRQNLTFPRNKIPENVLQITDPAFPELEISRERVRSDRVASHHLITAENAKTRFNTTTISGQLVGDQVFLTVYVYPNASTHVLDPFVTEVTNRKEQFHGIEAWVDVSNVEKLAALDQVRRIGFTEFAEHSDAGPVSRNSSCPDTSYEPVFLLGDSNTTRILGHETKSVNSSRTFCTEFDPGSYTISFNVIPYHVMKFDFAEFDQPLIISKIGRDQEIDVWIRGEKYKAVLKEMNFNAGDTGTHSYSGALDGVSQSRVVITLSENFTSGSVRRDFSPVGIKKDQSGNTIPVNYIYDQRDVENYTFSLANDVITPSIPIKHYE